MSELRDDAHDMLGAPASEAGRDADVGTSVDRWDRRFRIEGAVLDALKVVVTDRQANNL